MVNIAEIQPNPQVLARKDWSNKILSIAADTKKTFVGFYTDTDLIETVDSRTQQFFESTRELVNDGDPKGQPLRAAARLGELRGMLDILNFRRFEEKGSQELFKSYLKAESAYYLTDAFIEAYSLHGLSLPLNFADYVESGFRKAWHILVTRPELFGKDGKSHFSKITSEVALYTTSKGFKLILPPNYA